MKVLEHHPIPEMLGRRDTENGQWVIKGCEPIRGNPYTNIVDKEMVVPVSPEEYERVIRAHEMVHAKVSPADDFPRWFERGIASEQALRSVEEVRVNYLAKKAGFDVSVLKDGSELKAGETLAERGDWASCVYSAVGFALCDGGKDFLTGVRRVNRKWGEALREIVKKVEKEIVKADKTRTLSSTERDPRSGLAPLGFLHTERIAEMVDRLANPPQKEQEQEQENEQQEQESRNEDEGKAGKQSKKAKNGNPKDAPVDKEAIKKVRPSDPSRQSGGSQWAELKVRKLALTRHAPGGLGRKRRATDMGRNPRRIGNALADPQKRIFDATKKGNGGVVIIDGSGSMSLSTEDIVKIVDSAHGATVAVYSADSTNTKDNLLILAEKGKMVQELPARNGGNGVDGPALKWAIKQKQHAKAPVVFVTDGLVHGIGQGYNDLLAMDCINTVLKNNVIVRPNVAEAVKALEELKAGRRPARQFPFAWRQTWSRLNGTPLR